MTKVRFLTPVANGNDFYITGEERELTPNMAKQYFAKGIAEPVDMDNSGPDGDQNSDNPEIELPEGEPNESWKNDYLRAYMDQHKIEYSSDDTKAELLEKISKAE